MYEVGEGSCQEQFANAIYPVRNMAALSNKYCWLVLRNQNHWQPTCRSWQKESQSQQLVVRRHWELTARPSWLRATRLCTSLGSLAFRLLMIYRRGLTWCQFRLMGSWCLVLRSRRGRPWSTWGTSSRRLAATTGTWSRPLCCWRTLRTSPSSTMSTLNSSGRTHPQGQHTRSFL